jgi:hypothetical protein
LVALAAVEVAVFIQVNVGAFPGRRYGGAAADPASPPIDPHEKTISWEKKALVEAGLPGYQIALVDAVLNIPDVPQSFLFRSSGSAK